MDPGWRRGDGRLFRATLVALTVLGAMAGEAPAQRLTLVIVDANTRAPLEGALVTITDSVGTKLANRTTNHDGLVTGSVYDSVAFWFTVTRIGFHPLVTGPVILSPVRDTTLAFGLAPVPVELPAIVVEAERARHLDRIGFTDRRKLGQGAFLDPEEVERRQQRSPRDIAALLTTIPGVTIVPGDFRDTIVFTGVSSLNRGCGGPRIFVDGQEVRDGPLEAAVAPNDVLALEVYRRPAEVPAQWGGATSACGVLLIWTKRGVR
ncbi:MAG: hypothetical protein R2909_10545 [Gemmatimonadales bacterium]